MPSQFLYIRHGETAHNQAGRVMGTSPEHDVPLTATGIEQAKQAAVFLKAHPITTLWVSPARRAQQTAEIIAARLGITTLNTHPDLRERDWPAQWAGKDMHEIAAQAGISGVEKLNDLIDKLPNDIEQNTALGLRAQRFITAHVLPTRQQTLVVAHAGIYRALLEHWGYKTPPLVNCAVTHNVQTPQKWDYAQIFAPVSV
jgi:broad specificity phosphatase PhoE